MLIAALALACAAPTATEPLPSVAIDAPKADPLQLASLDETLKVQGETVAARQQRTRLSIPVTIGDAGPFRFVIDSGADHSVVGQQLAARLGLEPAGCTRLHSIAGVSLNPVVRVPGMRVGSATLDERIAPTLPEASIGAPGLIGIDALIDQRISLDFAQHSVTVEDARTKLVAHDGDIVVVARRQRGQLILAQAAAANTPVLAVIDTGAEMTMGNSALRARLFAHHAKPDIRTIELTSVTGATVTAELAILPELTVGRLRLRDVPVAFADAPPFALFGLAETPAVLLGTDILQAFRTVTLDFRRRRVRFSLR